MPRLYIGLLVALPLSCASQPPKSQPLPAPAAPTHSPAIPTRCAAKLAAYAPEGFVGGAHGHSSVAELKQRLRDGLCESVQQKYGLACDDERVEWSTGGQLIDWGEGQRGQPHPVTGLSGPHLDAYAHAEVAIVMARLEGSGASRASAREACCRAVDDACINAPSGSACSARDMICRRSAANAWKCSRARKRQPASSSGEPFELSCPSDKAAR